jgi:BON domain
VHRLSPAGKTAAHCTAIVAVVLLLSGCALAGRTFGRYVDDKKITGSVKLSLAARHLSHLRRVNVDVHEGTVYLTGTVNTEVEKSDADIAAWTSEGVEQVVNDIVVRHRNGVETVSALPDFRPRHPLLERFTWVTRVEAGAPGGPDLAYDDAGRLVATVYTVSSRALINDGFATLSAGGRSIDRVTVYPIPVRDDLPEPLYAIVLWHVAERPTAARR